MSRSNSRDGACPLASFLAFIFRRLAISSVTGTANNRSQATFKFVFIHNLASGSFDGLGRGGVEYAPYFEWGGLNTDGTPGFAVHRPGWAIPIQDLLLSNGVQMVFHGHDHLYVCQEYDANRDKQPDLIYQELPQPSSTTYNNTNSAADYGYTNGVILGNAGHLRVRVTPTQATFEYVRAFLPEDEGPGRTNGMISHAYSILSDWWRALYFGGDGSTTNAQSCATCDADGDHANNWQEYIANTIPTDPDSLFRITAISMVLCGGRVLVKRDRENLSASAINKSADRCLREHRGIRYQSCSPINRYTNIPGNMPVFYRVAVE